MSLHGTLISAHADHRLKDIHIPRNQREAGIDLMPWEERVSPFRSYLEIIGQAFACSAMVISALILLLAVFGR